MKYKPVPLQIEFFRPNHYCSTQQARQGIQVFDQYGKNHREEYSCFSTVYLITVIRQH